MTNDEKIAALEREMAELKAKVDPPKSTFVPISDEEWRDQMHQLREKRMAFAIHPETVRDLTVLDDNLVNGIKRDNRNAPTSPTGMIPNNQQTSGGGGGSSTPGWVAPTPLSNPPGVALADRLMDEQDRRDRAELAQRLGTLKR
jgi:hypothetical protein